MTGRANVLDLRQFLAFAALPVGLAVALGLFSTVGSPVSEKQTPASISSGAADPHYPLEISPSPIMLGLIDAGESLQTPLSVRNTRTEQVTLSRVEASCSCISLEPGPAEIGPGELRTMTMTFDASSEPDFVGELAIEIIAYLSDDTVAFRTEVKLSVVP